MTLAYEDYRIRVGAEDRAKRERFTRSEPVELRFDEIAADDPESILLRDHRRLNGRLRPWLDPWRLPAPDAPIDDFTAAVQRIETQIVTATGLPVRQVGIHGTVTVTPAPWPDIGRELARIWEEIGKQLNRALGDFAIIVSTAFADVVKALDSLARTATKRRREPRRSRSSPRRRGRRR